jgi:hypothetical protein
MNTKNPTPTPDPKRDVPAKVSRERVQEIAELAVSPVAKANPNAWVHEHDLIRFIAQQDAEIEQLKRTCALWKDFNSTRL